MINIFLALLLALVSVDAMSAAPIKKYTYGSPPNNVYASPDAICSFIIANVNRTRLPTQTQAFCKPPHDDFYVNWDHPESSEAKRDRIYMTPTCADGSPPDTTKALAMQCPDPPPSCLPETTFGSVTWKMFKGTTPIYNPWAEKPGAKNGMGCKVEVIEVEDCYTLPKSTDPSAGYCTFKTRQTGGIAENGLPDPNRGGDITDKDKTRENLPPTEGKSDGSCPRGTVNTGLSASGIPMCVGSGTTPTNAPPAPPKVETEKNEPTSDGGTKNTKTEIVTNSDGSKTTTTTVTVTGPGGEKSTTQDKTTGNSSSGAPGKETKPEDKSDVCKQNPNLAMCKNSTVGGKCGETTCTGDAIQCATLRSVAILQCKAEKDEEALKTSGLAAKGQSAIDGKDLEGLPGPKNGTFVNVPGMKSEGWLGNGAAFEDVSVSIRGQEVLIPLSKWSSYLLPFRYMLMIIASLISYRVLAGAVLKE